MDEFTKTELMRIDYLYGNDFKGDITTDDVKLISRFEYARAREDIESEMDREKQKEEISENLKSSENITNTAIENLNSILSYAMERLERLEKRERPTIEDAQKDEFNVVQRSAVTHDGK